MNDNDIITIRNYRFNKNDIYDIYDIERDVDVFYLKVLKHTKK